MTHGDTVAAALRGLRLLAEAEEVDGVLRTLASSMKMIPVLLHAAHAHHEDTKVEVCRLVRAFARSREIASQMVGASYTPAATGAPPPAAAGDASAIVPTGGELVSVPTAAAARPFLSVFGGLLSELSSRVQMEACLALEPLASAHRVQMCQAQVVSSLIALTHTRDDDALVLAASRVLKLLA